VQGGGRRSRQQQLRRPGRIRTATVGARAPPWPVLVTDGMESETIAARSPYQRPGAQRHTQNAALELKPPARLIAVANDRRAGPVPTDKPVAWRGVDSCTVLPYPTHLQQRDLSAMQV
jgi:hypothetical protein